MSNIVLWNLSNGIEIDEKDLGKIKKLPKYLKVLSDEETKNLVTTFKLKMYDVSIQYAWTSSINILDERLDYFGIEFLSEMVDRDNITSLDQISTSEKIELAFDLGMINSTAKFKLEQANETINHYSGRKIKEAGEKIDKLEAIGILNTLTKYILGTEIETTSMEFKGFRDSLLNENHSSNSESLNTLKISPYFYTKTTIRSILNFIKMANHEKDTSTLPIILNNANIFIVGLWKNLFNEDKKLIGETYSKAISEGYTDTVKALSSILDEIQGYDFVPETTRSTAYRKIAKAYLSIHYEFDNFYNEPIYAKKLNSMGTVIPKFALQDCLQAVIVSKIGNRYDTARDAQAYNNKILDKITKDQWKEFISSYIIEDIHVLQKIFYGNNDMISRWFDIVETYINFEFNIEDINANNLLKFSKSKNKDRLKKTVENCLEKITG